ncbi:HEPN domain-containing protein [Pasteurella atlantica]|uniref:HEPN domain-containing protein n=2 Tax=Pasteurellaceae TaxID=712 RepID=A0ACC6HJJ1_9PAST|nr:HEPN domain-containing protein [Pasteurella atlantica]MDP8050994.1 HEPN domain-containing protein [Pasteurella atlantica]MDP8147650.1 HEPN domain-containing protein [Pasteurella atlantica]
MNIINLEQQFKQNREQQHYSDHFCLRIHRSLSWLKKAENSEDLDTKFITLWIAFNSAYAREIEDFGIKDRISFNEFLLRICSCDNDNVIYNLVWKEFTQSIRLWLDNKFVFQPFWDFHNGKMTENEYIKAETKERERFFSALENQKTSVILDIMFSRLYTLRNQIIHGGATFNSSVNREQLKEGCAILSLLIPAMLDIMMKNHNEIDWGKPFYPVVK